MSAEVRPRARLHVACVVPLRKLRHSHDGGLGVTDFAVSGDEGGELDSRGAKVVRAEATADRLSTTCIVPTGAPLAAVSSLAEEVVANAALALVSRQARYSSK